ncbi:BAG family molecular chaperone regulator 7 [Tanacetum coccineum]
MSRFTKLDLIDHILSSSSSTEPSFPSPFTFPKPSSLYSLLTPFEFDPLFDDVTTITDLITPSFTTRRLITRRTTHLYLQSLSDRVSALELAFDLEQEKQKKSKAKSKAVDRKYTWTAEINSEEIDRKYKLTTEVKGSEKNKKESKWTAEIKSKKNGGDVKKYTFTVSTADTNEEDDEVKSEVIKKKDVVKKNKKEKRHRIVEIQGEPHDHGTLLLKQDGGVGSCAMSLTRGCVGGRILSGMCDCNRNLMLFVCVEDDVAPNRDREAVVYWRVETNGQAPLQIKLADEYMAVSEDGGNLSLIFNNSREHPIIPLDLNVIRGFLQIRYGNNFLMNEEASSFSVDYRSSFANKTDSDVFKIRKSDYNFRGPTWSLNFSMYQPFSRGNPLPMGVYHTIDFRGFNNICKFFIIRTFHTGQTIEDLEVLEEIESINKIVLPPRSEILSVGQNGTMVYKGNIHRLNVAVMFYGAVMFYIKATFVHILTRPPRLHIICSLGYNIQSHLGRKSHDVYEGM